MGWAFRGVVASYEQAFCQVNVGHHVPKMKDFRASCG